MLPGFPWRNFQPTAEGRGNRVDIFASSVPFAVISVIAHGQHSRRRLLRLLFFLFAYISAVYQVGE